MNSQYYDTKLQAAEAIIYNWNFSISYSQLTKKVYYAKGLSLRQTLAFFHKIS